MEYCDGSNVQQLECVLEGSWGFDASSGQSAYKQGFTSATENDENLFVTTFIPLKLSIANGTCVWLNPTPQSYRYCRPIHLQYRGETKDLILSEKELVDGQIAALLPLEARTSRNYLIRATSKLYMSIIDGKVLSTITGVPSVRCPYYNAKPTQFNNLQLINKMSPDQEIFVHGISPLHAWIRTLEFLLHLGYKNDPGVKSWRVIKTSKPAIIVEQRKQRIQREVRQELGLLIDVVRPGSVTTNGGNTARTALSDKNRSKFADILGLEYWLLDNLHTILVTISSGLEINAEKFGEFCSTTAQKYVASYGWYYMPVTIHKILIHGRDIIKGSSLPLGMLSEQAGETRKKFWRYDREHQTRKMNRVATLTDLLHRALESSDPVVSDYRLFERLRKIKRLPLPPEALKLLKPPEFGDNISVEDDVQPEAVYEDDNLDLESDGVVLMTEEELEDGEDK